LSRRKASEVPAREVIKWIHSYCKVPEGARVGEKIKLTKWQKEFIKAIYDNPRGPTRRALLSVGRKNGKAIHVTTPIATPRGWSTMGALKVGDEIFDERGQVCRVTYKSPVFIGHRCFRLTFADGTSIIADEEHRWLTRHRYRPWQGDFDSLGRPLRSGAHIRRPVLAVVTTAQIAESVYIQRRDGVCEHNHKLPVADCPEANLPIPPCVLGYWLGNGDKNIATITIGGYDELHIIEEIERELAYELTAVHASGGGAPRYSLTRNVDRWNRTNSMTFKLRAIGVLNNKHIPDIYKWTSREQRLALLQGLMDSDGTASGGNKKAPRCCFDVMNETLALDTLFLVRSLGFKATIREDRATLHGRDMGPCWSVSFTAYQEDRVFRLERRGACLPPRRQARSSSNAIVACDEVPSVPTVCVQVDSPSQLFLAGGGLTPTHNTSVAACLLLAHLCGPPGEKRPNSQLFSAAQSRDQAALIFQLAAKMVRLDTDLRDGIIVKESAKELHYPRIGTKYKALSSESTTAFGLSPAFIVHDELGQVIGAQERAVRSLGNSNWRAAQSALDRDLDASAD
jgi:Phage Terminase/LAGLIDADG-like domain